MRAEACAGSTATPEILSPLLESILTMQDIDSFFKDLGLAHDSSTEECPSAGLRFRCTSAHVTLKDSGGNHVQLQKDQQLRLESSSGLVIERDLPGGGTPVAGSGRAARELRYGFGPLRAVAHQEGQYWACIAIILLVVRVDSSSVTSTILSP